MLAENTVKPLDCGFSIASKTDKENKADCHKSRAPRNQRPTEGQTDRATDKAAYR